MRTLYDAHHWTVSTHAHTLQHTHSTTTTTTIHIYMRASARVYAYYCVRVRVWCVRVRVLTHTDIYTLNNNQPWYVRVRPSPSPSIYLHTEGKKKKRLTHARTNQTHARFNYHDDVHTTRACARCGSCHDGSNFYARKDRNISLYIYACAYIYRYTFTLGRTALLPAAIRKQRRNHCAHTYVVCTYI